MARAKMGLPIALGADKLVPLAGAHLRPVFKFRILISRAHTGCHLNKSQKSTIIYPFPPRRAAQTNPLLVPASRTKASKGTARARVDSAKLPVEMMTPGPLLGAPGPRQASWWRRKLDKGDRQLRPAGQGAAPSWRGRPGPGANQLIRLVGSARIGCARGRARPRGRRKVVPSGARPSAAGKDGKSIERQFFSRGIWIAKWAKMRPGAAAIGEWSF